MLPVESGFHRTGLQEIKYATGIKKFSKNRRLASYTQFVLVIIYVSRFAAAQTECFFKNFFIPPAFKLQSTAGRFSAKSRLSLLLFLYILLLGSQKKSFRKTVGSLTLNMKTYCRSSLDFTERLRTVPFVNTYFF